MAYAPNRLYDEKIREIKGRICRDVVKVREIMPFLPCLTQTDWEEVEAKREQYGNYSAVNLLLDNLRRRENWPEQLIDALRECSHPALADEIEEAYNQIRGINSAAPVRTNASSESLPSPSPASAPAAAANAQASVPAAASATVTTATIHDNPQLLVKPLPNEALVQSSALLPSMPDQVEAPVLVSAPRTPTCHPSEPALSAELPPSYVIPPSPVSSPQVAHRPAQIGVSVSSVTAPASGSLNSQTAHSVPTLVAAPSISNNPVTVSSNQSNNSCTPLQHPITLEESKIPVGIPENSTSVKHPIQDTCPPKKETHDLQITSNRNKPGERVHNSVLTNSNCDQANVTPPGTSAPTGAAALSLPRVAAADDMCFSKPGILREEEPQSEVSFSSQDLEISHATAGTEGHPARASFNSQRVMEIANPCCSVSSDELMLSDTTMHFSDSHPENAVQNSTLRESSHLNNGITEEDLAFSLSEPEENHYESVSQSMQMASDVLEYKVEFSELPSVQNLGQPVHTINQSDSPNLNNKTENLVQSVNKSTQDRYEMQENNVFASVQTRSPADTLGYSTLNSDREESRFNASDNNVSSHSEQREEPRGLLNQLQSNSHLIATAIGVTAIFIAWRLK